MSASSAPAAKAALLSAIVADAAMSGVQVSYAHPGAAIAQDAVYFERTLLDEQPIALGAQRRDESYVLELVISVGLDGDDAQTCEERAWALVAIVENLLRPPPANLSGTLTRWAAVDGVEMTPAISPSGAQRIAIAVMRIRCRHRK